MATYTGNPGQDDSFTGTADADTFFFAVADLTAADTLLGRGGSDLLRFTTAGTITAAMLGGVANVENIRLFSNGAAVNSLTVTDALLATAAGSTLSVTGGAGNDTIDGSSLAAAYAIDITAGAGLDTLRGGLGADVFHLSIANLDGDTIVGGGGAAVDTLVFSTAGVIAASRLATVSGIEKLVLSDDGANDLVIVTALASTSAVARLIVIGGAGADSVNGSGLGAAYAIDVTAGAGLHTLRGGAGADIFRFRNADLAGDTVRGGTGTAIDTLAIAGSGAIDLADVRQIEAITLDRAAHGLTLSNALVASANGSALGITGGAGADTIDAALVTGGTLTVMTSNGADGVDVTTASGLTLLGDLGGGRDTLAIRLTGAGVIALDGGTGTDAITLDSAAASSFTMAPGLSGFETIDLIDTDHSEGGIGIFAFTANDTANLIIRAEDDTNAYEIVLNGAGQQAIGAASGDTLSGTVGFQTLLGNDGDDLLDARDGADVQRGGAGNDSIAYDGNDSLIEGGTGNDFLTSIVGGFFTLGNADQSGSDSADVTGFENVILAGSLANAGVIGTAAANTIIGGSGFDVIDGVGGSDYIDGGGGNDIITYRAGADFISGGLDIADTLVVLTGENVDLRNANQIAGIAVTGFESVDASGANAAVVLRGGDGSFASLFGSALDDTIFGGAAGAFIIGGGGADTLRGGTAGENFLYTAASEFAGGETVRGGNGAGYDTVTTQVSIAFLGNGISEIEQITALNGATVTLSGSNASRLDAVTGGFLDGLTETFIVTLLSGETVDLGGLALVNADAGDSLKISGTAGDETVTVSQTQLTVNAGNGADNIYVAAFAHYGDGSQIMGEGGDDRIDYADSIVTIDGGTGIDTLVGHNDRLTGSTILDLGAIDQSFGDTAIVKLFANVDWGDVFDFALTATGDSADNVLTGGRIGDTLGGGGGDDTLNGGSLDSSNGDMLTGGAGNDRFVFDHIGSIFDTIADFVTGEDTLIFSSAAFDVVGAIDTMVTGNAAAPIAAADIFLYTTGTLATTGDVANLLAGNASYTGSSGLFVVGADDDGSVLLYYAQAPGTVFLVAELGGVLAPADLALSDFAFG